MFYPFVIAIISTLLVMNYNSIYALRISQYFKIHAPIVEEFFYQEKMVKEALDSYCRNNFNTCNAQKDSNGQIRIAEAQIMKYAPVSSIQNLNFAQDDFIDIYIDTNDNTIKLVHSMTNTQKSEYKNNFRNKWSNISCLNGSSWPCTNDQVLKSIEYSEELQILFINDQINTLNNQLATASAAEQVAIINQINNLNNQKTALNNRIAARKSEAFFNFR